MWLGHGGEVAVLIAGRSRAEIRRPHNVILLVDDSVGVAVGAGADHD
jgi:hypothetical protein